ncbi:MAG: DUF2169 domain-containing protein [Deltaproteobacteria bacterium]|nr:DUF2169 domain-containing protein [Deltaproteobacteria bacterium]
MRTKNLTPFPVGVRVTSTRPPVPEMVVIVRGRFALAPGAVATAVLGEVEALAQGPLSGETFAEEDEARVGAPTYAGDFADWKPRAEVLFVGSAHTPRHRPLGWCDIGLALGRWQKRLRVFGVRAWAEDSLGAKPSEPTPFTSLRLGYERAFGGSGVSDNPIGLGANGVLLPCIEYPAGLIESRDDRPPPASLGPIASTWAPRADKLGSAYGPSYASRAPYFAEDFDWSHFQSAPQDQWLPSFPQGDEPLVLENLHAEHGRLETRLPGLRIRAFANDVEGHFREVPLVLDTLLIDGDASEVLLTWRGRTPVRDAELDDVTGLLIVSEPLAEPPGSLEAWRDELVRFEADPLGLGRSLPPEIAAKAADPSPDARIDGMLALLEHERPGATASLTAEQARNRSGSLREVLRAALAANENEAPVMASRGAPNVHLGLGGVLADARAELARLAPDRLPQLDAALDAARLDTLDPSVSGPSARPIGEDAPGPGANLDGRDLSGLDLSGVNLEGASLRGATLKGTRLQGARLVGANLEGALLFQADLSDADASRARLTRVNASRLTLVRARLDEAVLDHSSFTHCDATDARLPGVAGELVVFSDGVFVGASFLGAKLSQADFEGAVLERANFEGAALGRAIFLNARATGARFERATCDGATFERAELGDAVFAEAHGVAASFLAANLARADLRWTRFLRCHFDRSTAEGARFDAADLTGSRLLKARLDGASFRSAKLVSVDLSKTSLAQARFQDANLYDAKLIGAKGVGARFDGANLLRALRSS